MQRGTPRLVTRRSPDEPCLTKPAGGINLWAPGLVLP